MANFFMLAYYDWDYRTTSNDLGIERAPIPAAIWFVCGVLHLVAHTLDGIDGKQARRTGSSTPLGKGSSLVLTTLLHCNSPHFLC